MLSTHALDAKAAKNKVNVICPAFLFWGNAPNCITKGIPLHTICWSNQVPLWVQTGHPVMYKGVTEKYISSFCAPCSSFGPSFGIACTEECTPPHITRAPSPQGSTVERSTPNPLQGCGFPPGIGHALEGRDWDRQSSSTGSWHRSKSRMASLCTALRCAGPLGVIHQPNGAGANAAYNCQSHGSGKSSLIFIPYSMLLIIITLGLVQSLYIHWRLRFTLCINQLWNILR